MKENLSGILFMLLAMARFAIEDGVFKDLSIIFVLRFFTEMLAPLFFASFVLIPLAMAALILQSVPLVATLEDAL